MSVCSRWARACLCAGRWVVAALLLAGAYAFAAGGEAAAPQTGSDAPDGVFPRVVRHWQGETLIPSAPRRVAAISTGQTDALLTLGLVPAGGTRDERGSLYPDYLRQAYPAAQAGFAATVDLGNRVTPDLEALAALRPDLILVHRTVLKPGVLALLQRIAPTVVTRGTGAHWKADFVLLADAVGRRDQARAWLANFAADARNAASERPGAAPQVSFVQTGGGRLRIMGQASFVGGIARDMGLARPASQDFAKTSQDISAERLDLADGDWVFYGARGDGAASLTGSPLWRHLQAVGQNQAVRVDYDAFYMNAGPTAARGVLRALDAALAGAPARGGRP